MNETIYLKYPWNTQEAILGAKYHLKNSLTQKIINTIYLILAIFHILFGLYSLLSLGDLGGISSIIWGLIFIFFSKLNFILFARNIKRLNYKNKEIEWEISRDKIVSRIINLSESTYSWELIQGVLDTPKGFLLYPQKNIFHWLPKQAFTKEEDIALFAFIAQNKVKNFQQTK
ncbi:MAG: YcxB family protein [Waterburya sp.]